MALPEGNDTQGTLLGLQAEPPPLPGLAAPARKYHSLMELGRGGSAVVSAALARGIGGFSKLVVLKTTKEELCAHADAVRSSLNEARLAARMSHPNIVQVYEVYQDAAGVPVIVMEYLDGLSLSRVARQGQHTSGKSLRVALTVLCKVLEGIRYAHGLSDFDGRPLGIVHRDISPQNVMLTYDGQVKLVDFGTAKLLEGGEQSLSGMLRGKIGYMPPEQVCADVIDGRVDLFAVGVMLWEAVAGKRLWGELNHPGIVRRLMEHDIPGLAAAAPGVDPELERICMRALAPEPAQRYASAAEFLRDLEGYLAQHGGSVPALELGEMVQTSCADLKRAREESLRAALAQLEDWQFDGDVALPPEITATQLTIDRPVDTAPPTFQPPPRARTWLWVSSLVGCVLGGVLIARSSMLGVPVTQSEPAATPALASAALAAPAPASELPLPPEQPDDPALVAAAVPRSASPPASNAKGAKPAQSRAARRTPTSRARAATKLPTVQPVRPNPCDPPYSVDAHGIKRFHRECWSSPR